MKTNIKKRLLAGAATLALFTAAPVAASAAAPNGPVSYTFSNVVIDGQSYIITGGQVKDKSGLKQYCNYYKTSQGTATVDGTYRSDVPLTDTSSDAVKTYCVSHYVDRTV